MSKREQQPPPSSDPQSIIDEQGRTIDRLRHDSERLQQDSETLKRNSEKLQRENERLQREGDKLRRRIERLLKELDAALRDGKRQAAPFSKGAPKSRPKRPGRKAGENYGKKGHRRVPRRRVDERYAAPLPASCPDCGGSVKKTGTAKQYQEEIPPVRPVLRQFEIEVGCCTGCRRRVQGRHALQTSDAIGAAGVQLGPNAVALAACLNKQMGLSFGKVSTLLLERFGLSVTRGGLSQALDRLARRALPSYEALIETVRGSPMVVPDETGWKEGGHLVWMHAFTTPTETVYRIARGRGYAEAVAVLGADFGGTLVRDGWAPYRKFVHANHQTCVGHLLRRCKELLIHHPHSTWLREVKKVLQDALSVRDRFKGGKLSRRGLDVARGRLAGRLVRLLEDRHRIKALDRFGRHLITEFPAIFTFLIDTTLDATNWRAEQALRPAVITRKVNGGGNRTRKGAQTQQVIATIIRTGTQRELDQCEIFVEMLRSRTPIVPKGLRTPPE